MKSKFLLIVSLLWMSVSFAQQAGLKTYVLHFKDKGVNKSASINPSLYLSEKAVERRLKYKIAFDESDLPVNEQYAMALSNSGARILTRSRWLNAVVVEASAEVAGKIAALPFISDLKLLDNNTEQVSTGKPFFETEKVNPWAYSQPSKKVMTDVYDYGAAFNQIDQLKGQYLHNRGFSGQGMTIAVLDAGFQLADKMPCFDSLRANNQILGTHDFAVPGNNVYDSAMFWHGTSVLSCMGAYINGQMVGTAPKASYWLIRTEVAETEKIIEEYYWVSGAEFADSVGADLINSSLGYTTFDDPSTNHTYADMDGNTTVVTIGADKAAQKGILVVNSAGNSGGGGWWYISAPADGDSVLTVGAVDANGIRAGFSSVGPTYDGRIKPDVSAQGAGAALFFPTGLGYGSGTSFSSPITCGISACLWQASPELNNMQIIEAIKATASQANQADSLLGWGISDYKSAFTLLSVNNQPVEKVVVTYPNPFTDKLTLGLPVSLHGEYKIEIINIQGEIVYTRVGSGESLHSLQINDLANMTPGIYLLRVKTAQSDYSARIIKN